MKIAQLAPLAESVPPRLYGGTERIVSYLSEELIRLGHEVSLFASGDSRTQARLHAICSKGLRGCREISNPLAFQTLLLEKAFRIEEEFDVIHSHLDFWAFPFARRSRTPVLTTLHGRLDLPELRPIYEEFSESPVISISNAQRRPLAWANWQGTVYHGLPRDLYSFHAEPGRYLAFVGRLTPEKRPDHAIEVAKRVGMPLRIAAKVDPVDQDYFDREIEPLLSHSLIEYVGEITDAEKNAFIGNAYALIAPFDWPEPFGLVFIEALACGTPVLAYRRGSVPEIIDEGETGFICDSLADMVKAVTQAPLLNRRRCRDIFDERFTVERMVQDYIQIYEKAVSTVPFRSRRSLQAVNY